MVDYVELLIGEALLGDVNNTYLYVGDDFEARCITLGYFVRRVKEEGQQATSVSTSTGKVVVNETQRFFFVERARMLCVAKGMTFDRIFIDVATRSPVMWQLVPHLAIPNGDFV